MGRRSVWSDERVIALAGRFVPAADEVWRLQRDDDPECRWFRTAVRGDAAPSAGTMQGVYVLTAGGRCLGRLNSTSPEPVLAMLQDALAAYAALPAGERGGAGPPPRAAHRWEDSCPDRGLVLQRFARDVPADPGAPPRAPVNLDALWFSADEARGLLPADPVPGAVHDLPRAVVERIAALSLVDNVRGQTLPFAAAEVAGSTLQSEVVGRDGDVVTLRLSGATRAVAAGAWLGGDSYWRPDREWPRRVATRVLGAARYDLAAGRFVAFELVALGTREGRTQFNGRHGEPPGPHPIGFLLRLAPAGYRVAPTFVNVYDADWVRHPAPAAAAPAPARRLPNVVVVLADDLGLGDLGCYNGDSRIPTPNLDRLAREAVRCTDAHSPSAVCTPTRYGLLTGRYAWRSRLTKGVFGGYDRLLIEPGRATVASVLRDAGYRTACVGKWHLGLGRYDPEVLARTDYDAPLDAGPHTVGFDEVLAIPASLDMPPYVWVVDDRLEAPAAARTEGSARRWSGGGGFWREGAMAADFDFYDVLPRCARRAVRFVRERASEPERPFFLYLALPAPHTPWMPTEDHRGRSEAGFYGDFVAQVDAHLGELLDALEQTGAAADTLLLFTSDNGAHWRPEDVARYGHDSHTGLRGMKADIHEAGHRVPLLVRWPGELEPGTCDALLGLQDLFATCTALVGRAPDAGGGEDSLDMMPALRGEPRLRQQQVHHSLDGMFALRRGPYKWIEGRGSGGFTQPRRAAPQPGAPAGQLYDLAADRGERRDLAAERTELVDELRARLRAVRER